MTRPNPTLSAAFAEIGRSAIIIRHQIATQLAWSRRPLVGWNPRLERVTDGVSA